MTEFSNQQYIRAEDLLCDGAYKTRTIKIVDVLSNAPLTRRLDPYAGYALVFENCSKVLGLGLTNEQLIKVVAGDARPEKWIGLSVTIAVRRVRGKRKGESQPAIRIMPPQGTLLRSGLVRELGEEW
jgi:hypothetical protein